MKKKDKKTVAVIFGGPSYEREISVLTGVFVLNVLKTEYDLIPVYIDAEGDFYTSPKMFKVKTFTEDPVKSFIKISFAQKAVCRYGKPKPLKAVDCALNCCHGGWGEGGGVSALMQIYGIPLASPDMPLSAVFMDKTLTKLVVSGMGIPSARFWALSEAEYKADPSAIEEKIGQIGYPVILKPAHLGSSIGIRTVHGREKLREELERAFVFDKTLLIEEYLSDKRDINCAAYGYDGKIFVSECEEPASSEEILSFREKYLTGGKSRKADFPADIPKELSEEIRSMTEKLYRELRFSGMVRADYLISGGKVYFNELNTVPGSLAYYLFTPKISGAKELFSSLIEEALGRGETEKCPVYSTGVLEKLPDSGGSKRM